MTIRDYIQKQVFFRRAEEQGCLVIYDPQRRYRDLALSMDSDRCRVINAAESVIEQREAATEALRDLAIGTIHELILWIPSSRPQDEDQRQKDPFSVFGSIGSEFPSGDGDDYASLCRRAKPDHVPEINRLFAEGEPGFDTIDALDQGGSWPKLKTLLGVMSPKEIFLGILSPKPAQEDALKQDPTWSAEVREFVLRSLGHKLRTRGQTRASIAEELWRVILFSEFVFDSAGESPAPLETVPRAGSEARDLIYEVCDELRKHQDHKDVYLTTAQEIEAELVLPERSKGMKNLGLRDTFSFEERHFLQRVVEEAMEGSVEAARKICDSRRKSIWLHDEKRLVEWSLAARALDLLDAANRLSRPKFPSLETIIEGYALTWRELDRHHRELEQAVNDWNDDHEGLEKLVNKTRSEYFKSVEALQAEFVKLVQAEGWPPSSGAFLRNSRIFNEVVAPALDIGERVAYFLVDSLRYELGVELEKQLSERDAVRVQIACAQLPTYTEVGMASLMPDAETALRLTRKEDKLVTTLGGEIASDPSTRLKYLKSRKGDLCEDIELDQLVRYRRPKIGEKVKLLIVRTRDLDAIAHESPHQVLQVIPSLVRQIIRGVGKVAELGFQRAVLVTDHGFLLFHEQVAGNVASRPPGKWLVEKSRCCLGSGESDASNVVLKRSDLSIPGDFESFAVPRTVVPYSRGQIYYHEGLSLQECVLPCLTVELKQRPKRPRASVPNLFLSYRQGKTEKVTMRCPVIDLAWPEASLFVEEGESEFMLEAVDSKGSVVGWVGAGESVNPATGGVRIRPGQAIPVGLRMEETFEGNFTVRALDPVTNLTLGELSLKTAYLE